MNVNCMIRFTITLSDVTDQAVRRRLLTGEAQVTPCGICGEHEVTGTGFSPSAPVFLRPYDSTNASPSSLIYTPPTRHKLSN